MDKAELAGICERVLKSRDSDARVVALALQRYLVGDGRKARFDKRSYMRSYMAEYRLRGLKGGKRRRKQR